MSQSCKKTDSTNYRQAFSTFFNVPYCKYAPSLLTSAFSGNPVNKSIIPELMCSNHLEKKTPKNDSFAVTTIWCHGPSPKVEKNENLF
jgi:hypothetical protein